MQDLTRPTCAGQRRMISGLFRQPGPGTRGSPLAGGRLPADTASLFHRDALGQISWLVDVAASIHSDVVGKQLERDHGQQW